MKKPSGSLLLLLLWICFVPDIYPQEPTVEKKPARTHGFDRLIEAEAFEGVAEPVTTERGDVKTIDGKWTKIQDDHFSKGASIVGPGDDVSFSFDAPSEGEFHFWIFHLTHPSLSTAFSLIVQQHGGDPTRLEYAAVPASETRDDKNYIYGVSWDACSVKSVHLKKGKTKLTLARSAQTAWSTSVDAIFVTDDPDFKPKLMEAGKWDVWSR